MAGGYLFLAQHECHSSLGAMEWGLRPGHNAESSAELGIDMTHQSKWTFEKVRKVAQQFHTRKDFRLDASKAYSAAQRYGWLNRVCSHMKCNRKDWTLEECRQVARQYNSRKAFMFEANAAYQSAYRKGWLDQICNHM